MDFLSSVDGYALAMYLELGLAIGAFISLWIVRRSYQRCRYCGNLHRERPKHMNALVFMMTICRRAEEIANAKEMRWQPQ